MQENKKIFILANSYIREGLLLLSLLSCISCNNINKDSEILGYWKGSYNNREFSIIFNPGNKCDLTYFDDHTNTLQKVNGIYELDFSKKPVPLSIRKIPQLSYPLHTIIEFINDDSIRIALFSPKWRLRPVSFENGKTINLKRISDVK